MGALIGLEPRSYYIQNALLVVLGLYVLYRVSQWMHKVYRVRTRYHDIPSLPRHLIWGNLINAGKKLNPSLNRHPDYGFKEIWHEVGEPGCFLVEFAPIEDRAFLIIAELQYAEVLANSTEEFKYSIPKSNYYDHLKPVLGAESIATEDGAAWKAMRKRFNPLFRPRYIYSLRGPIVSRVEIFVKRLQSLTNSGITFKMANYAADLTIDIITQLTIAHDSKAQSTPESHSKKSRTGLLRARQRLKETVYAQGQGVGLHTIDPFRPLESLFYETIVNHKLTRLVKARIGSPDTTFKSKSIMQLAVSGHSPNKAFIRSCVDQVKTFLFAGQDTTATLIQWIRYEMSKASHSPQHATILSRLRGEHDAVFGPHPLSALQVLSSSATPGSEAILTSRLPYTTAFIKETLRLHPPAATVRAVPWEATSLTLPFSSQPVSIAGLQIYPSLHLIQRNPKVWGPDAHVFNPGRWLDEAYLAKLPAGAYRPFERGPRNCIGQELAILGVIVVLACVARGFEFEKVGLTGRPVVDGGDQEREVWSDHVATSVPVDGMVMRVRMSEKAEF